LYHDSQLWVLFNELLQMNLIHEMHDQSSVDHSDILRTMKVIKRNYYWSFMRKMIDWYIQNCYICQCSKTFRNKSNDLLQSLLISEQRWQDIAMNFIINLFNSSEYNVILMIICKLLKKDIIFLASLMMKISLSKRQLKCWFNEYIELMIYQAS